MNKNELLVLVWQWILFFYRLEKCTRTRRVPVSMNGTASCIDAGQAAAAAAAAGRRSDAVSGRV